MNKKTKARGPTKKLFSWLVLLGTIGFIAYAVHAEGDKGDPVSAHATTTASAPSFVTAPKSTTTTVPPTSTTTNALENSTSGSTNSNNWAGYDLTGRAHYHSITGTFRVPQIMTGSPDDSAISEWVGLGGDGNSGLIQAGVMEAMVPCTGGQTQLDGPYNPNVFYTCPWVVAGTGSGEGDPVPTLAIHIGDRVTVAINFVGGDNWHISMTDDTTGGTWATAIAYNGSTPSADWIVENPTGSLEDLAPIVNSVVFTKLNASLGLHVQTTFNQDILVNPNHIVPIDYFESGPAPVLTPSNRNTLVGLLTYGFNVVQNASNG